MPGLFMENAAIEHAEHLLHVVTASFGRAKKGEDGKNTLTKPAESQICFHRAAPTAAFFLNLMSLVVKCSG